MTIRRGLIASRRFPIRFLKACFLVLAGTLVGLLLAEAVLRIVRPDLRNLVDSKYVEHRHRIHSNPRNFAGIRPHPDSLENHLVIHNSLGLRQHREFSPEKPDGTVRIGVFGDSFTENWRLPVQYSLTEPLDYLLNRTGKNVEVLNFGTDGYGTDQIYLQYLDEGRPLDLDVVVYLYCQNDLTDILADGLIDVDERGNLIYLPKRAHRPFLAVAKRFYLTYFVLEVLAKSGIRGGPPEWEEYENATVPTQEEERANRDRYQSLPRLLHENQEHPHLERALGIFSSLMDAMKSEMEVAGATFCVALVPGTRAIRYENHNRRIAGLIEEKNIPVLDLYPVFEAWEARGERHLFFEKDTHWNEEGCKVASLALFDLLGRELGIEVDEEFVSTGLNEYYRSFEPSLVSDEALAEIAIPASLAERIRNKYLALERFAPPMGGSLLEPASNKS